MKKLLLLLILAPAVAGAQTKRIAHRSHSGKSAAYSASRGSDDFGLRKMDRLPVADSAAFRRDSSQSATRRRLVPSDSAAPSQINKRSKTTQQR